MAAQQSTVIATHVPAKVVCRCSAQLHGAGLRGVCTAAASVRQEGTAEVTARRCGNASQSAQRSATAAPVRPAVAELRAIQAS